MRLVQKSLAHTGYVVLKDGRLVPCFTSHLVNEAKSKVGEDACEIYGTNVSDIPKILSGISYYKEKYGVLPQNLVAELRTGFNNSRTLHQHNSLFLYK